MYVMIRNGMHFQAGWNSFIHVLPDYVSSRYVFITVVTAKIIKKRVRYRCCEDERLVFFFAMKGEWEDLVITAKEEEKGLLFIAAKIRGGLAVATDIVGLLSR